MTNKEKDVKLEDENLEKDNVSEEENVIENEDNNLNENTENNEEDESKENSEDTFTMLRKSKDEVKKLTNEVQTLKDRLLRQTA